MEAELAALEAEGGLGDMLPMDMGGVPTAPWAELREFSDVAVLHAGA